MLLTFLKNMKSIHFSFVVVFLFSFLFSVSFLVHADSASGEWCHTISTVGPVSSTYGSPINLFNEVHEPLISVVCYGKEKTLVNVGSGYPTQYIYKYGYRKVDGKWTKTTFSGALKQEEWIIGSATASIEGLDTGEEGKILAYICQKIGNDWKCGCADKVCSSQKWQLQIYKNNLDNKTDSDIDTTAYKVDNEVDVHYPMKYLGLPGETITLVGSGFEINPASSILWNGKVEQINVSSPTGDRLDIIIPNLPPGKYEVKVKEGDTVCKYGVGLWIGTGDNSPAPVITHITPEYGYQGGTFTVHGSGFTKENNDAVTLFGVLTGLPSEDGTSITFAYDPFDEKLVSYNENAVRTEHAEPVYVTIMNTSGQSNMKMFYLNI